jgi:hypothetical protein
MKVSSGPQVKGVSFLSVMSVVEKHRGRALAEGALRTMSTEVGDAFRYGTIIAAGWYPIAWYAEMWRSLKSVSGGGDEFVRFVGRASIDQDFNTIYKTLFRMLSPKTLVSIGVRHFSNIYDTGSVVVVEDQPTHVRVKWTGCAGFTRPMWIEVLGACERLAELAGGKQGRGVIEQGGSEGEGSCLARIEWR